MKRLNRIRNKLGTCRGFTLIELSVVLTIIAVILGSSMAMLVASTQAAQYNATVNTMNAIEQALLNYVVAFNRLPCPSLLTALPTSSTYGVEAANPGTGNCTSGSPSIPSTFLYQSSGNSYRAAEGGVPTISLNLPDSYMYDGWGRRIRYAVDTSLTAINTNFSTNTCGSSGIACWGTGANAALPPPLNGYYSSTTTGITIKDYTGAVRSNNAAYVLISHGANGHGAYTAAGIALNASSTNSAEQSNCHCSSTAGSNTYNAQYYQETPSAATASNASTVFDDIVAFKESWQLRSSIVPAPLANYLLYISDTGNSRIEVLNAAGSYVTAYPTTAGGNGVTMDSSQNIWIGQSCGLGLITSGSSTLTNNYYGGTCANSQGSFYDVNTIAFDNTGNLWVVNSGYGSTTVGNNVQKCTVSGSLSCTLTLGAGFNGASGTKGHTGSANNQFYFPYDIVFDKGNNVWISDSGNGAVKQFSNSGTFIQKITTGLSAPTGLAIDPTGTYLWIADYGNGNLFEYQLANPVTNTPTLINTFSNLFYDGTPTLMAFDPSGTYLWVTDWYGVAGNEVLYRCTTSGSCTTFSTYGSANGDLISPVQIYISSR